MSLDISAPTSGPATHKNEENDIREQNLPELMTSRIPCVTLDSDTITAEMAGRLAISLLGHVMFLKSQVPFPVMQLANMPGGQSDTRAARKRADILASFDTLSSHLHTTFIALSTAFARKSDRDRAPSTSQELAQAILVIVVGPSAGSARARVVFAVDGLEVKLWGERDGPDTAHLAKSEPLEGADESSEEESGSEEDTSESGSGEEESESESELGLDSDLLPSDQDSDLESSSTDSIIDSDGPLSSSPPPSSRSPSPADSPTSLPPSPPAQKAAVEISSPTTSNIPLPPRPELQSRTSSYASSQAALHTAERLLSRTLASACAEEGGGMSAELAPTQTHILLHAPRRFSHPAWTPKMGVAKAMDDLVESFMEDSGLCGSGVSVGTRHVKAKRRGTKVEGVWVRCRAQSVVESGAGSKQIEETEEENELIWWTWDGKLVGFADW